MRDQNRLFFGDNLDNQLCARQAQVSKVVNKIPKDQFLISSDQELLDHVVHSLTIEALVLHEDQKTMEQQETRVDVSGDPMRYFSPEQSEPFYIPGTQVNIDIPFSGEEWIFRYKTNPYQHSLNPPCAEINHGSLRISISLPDGAKPERFKEAYEHQLQQLRFYIVTSSNQISCFNENLPQLAQQAIDARRKRLDKHQNIAALLAIPLAKKLEAPSVTPLKVQIRRAPSLPVPPKTGLQPEPGISDGIYEQVLHFIRHQGRSFERTPSTYAIHDEEGLRDIILAQLNGYFEGDAIGEVFRRKGKTDICIEQDNRAAFVGECKIWKGPSSITAALDQLLGYLTWRDSKAALIIFNTKNKDFSRILKELPVTLNDHKLFIQDLKCDEHGEWSVQMRSLEDAGRRVKVHVFIFNLYNHSSKCSST